MCHCLPYQISHFLNKQCLTTPPYQINDIFIFQNIDNVFPRKQFKWWRYIWHLWVSQGSLSVVYILITSYLYFVQIGTCISRVTYIVALYVTSSKRGIFDKSYSFYIWKNTYHLYLENHVAFIFMYILSVYAMIFIITGRHIIFIIEFYV